MTKYSKTTSTHSLKKNTTSAPKNFNKRKKFHKNKKNFNRRNKKRIPSHKQFIKYFTNRRHIVKCRKTKFLVRKSYAFIKRLSKYIFHTKVENATSLKKNFLKKITIKFTQNNIFCSLKDLKRNKLLHTGSSGSYKVIISKRKMKKNYKKIINIFFKKIKKNYKNFNNTIFNIISPFRYRKRIFRILRAFIKKTKQKKENNNKKYLRRFKQNILLNIVPKKCFNGCRAKKQIRKKRRLYRIFK